MRARLNGAPYATGRSRRGRIQGTVAAIVMKRGSRTRQLAPQSLQGATCPPQQRGVMIETVEAQDSSYRFMPGVSQYSCGIAALAGFTIERARFADPVPLKAAL